MSSVAEPKVASRRDLILASTIMLAADVAYAATVVPDLRFDSFRFASFLRDGALVQLVTARHALGNLVTLGAFRALRGVGAAPDPMELLATVNVVAASLALGLLFLTARRLGALPPAAIAATAILGAAYGVWALAARGTVYGTALAGVVVCWFAAAAYTKRPTVLGAGVLGAAAAVAVAAHLASIALVPAAVLLVLLRPPDRTRGREQGLMAFGGAALAVGGVMVLLSGGVASGWSPSAIGRWVATARTPPGDESLAVGFGLRGLVVAVASPDRSGVGHLLVPLALAGAFLGIPAARVWFLVRRGGPGRAVGLALALHVALAVLAASWFLGTNSDLFAIALPSVALLWALPIAGPARPSAQGRRRPSAQALTLASSAVLVVMLASWNAWTGVRGARGLAAGRRAAAETIAKRTPEGAYLLLSAVTAPRVAYLGLDASTGWGALVAAVHDGAARPGLLAVLRRHEGQRLFVSSAAFRLSPPQVAYLGTTEEDLWRALRDCCAPQPVASFHAGDDPETLYELARPAP